jgi:hypothetical protein
VANIEVLIDRKSNDLAITLTDDAGNDSESTLTLEDAWKLVTDLNEAITKLLPSIINKGSVVAEAVKAGIQPYAAEPYRAPEQVQAAVLEAIGADQKRPRHVPPGFPATLKKAGLREYVEPEPVGQ